MYLKMSPKSWNSNIRKCSGAAATKLRTLKEMPGLSKLPLIGVLHHFLPLVGSIGPMKNFFEMLSVFHERFGSMVKLDGIFARSAMVIMYDPEHYDKVYRAEEDNPLRPGFETIVYYRTELRKSKYDGVYGLTTAQGAQWRDFRTKVNPALLKIKLVNVYKPSLDEIAKDFVTRLYKIKNEQNYLERNFYTEVTKWSLESVAYVSLGTRIGCLRDNLSKDDPASSLMVCARDILELAFKLESGFNLWKHISMPSFRKIVKALDDQWEVSSMFIEKAKKRINRRDCEIPEEEKSIIEKLLSIDEKVAFTTIALLYQLATNPEKQEKVRAEFRAGLSNKQYLKACLKETLRIMPVLPANLRRTSKDHIVGGYLIPKGIEVIAPNEYLSRSEKYYPQPLQFIPERWLVEKHDPLYYGNAHPMVTQPFGFGVRTCIGRRIAELEIETMVGRVIDEFQVSWYGPSIKVITSFVNAFEKPFNFKFETAR